MLPNAEEAFPGAAQSADSFLLGKGAAGAKGGRLGASWTAASAVSLAGGGVGVDDRRPLIPSLECSVQSSFAANAVEERGVGASMAP